MQVIFRNKRQVVIDDIGDMADVDSACGDIGRNQNPEASITKTRHGGGALSLSAVTVQAGHRVPILLEMPGHTIGPCLGACEDQNGTLPGMQFIDQRFVLPGGGGFHYGLLDFLHRPGHRPHGHSHGMGQITCGELFDIRRQGGGKQKRLPRLGQIRKNLVQLRGKPHVEHPVGFVQNEDIQ